MEFLEQHTQLNKDTFKIVMTDSGKENTTVRVTNGIELEDIMDTIDKIEYKEKVGGGRVAIVREVGLTMRWSAYCALMNKEVNTLESPQETFVQEVRNI